jgi:taurine--2-oxoglutarate transaminase
MSVNIGHGDRRVIDAITEQATKLQYVQPAFATEPGPARREARRDPAGRPRQGLLHARRRRGDRERDQARAPLHGPAQGPRPLPAYHGATLGAMTLTGDPRRWANEPGLVGVVRYPDTHRWGEKEPRPVEESLQGLEDVIRYEGAAHDRGVFLETIVGTNGILIPPDGYIQGVRELCDRYDILMVADEVMAGFGRTGAGSRSTTGTSCRTS